MNAASKKTKDKDGMEKGASGKPMPIVSEGHPALRQVSEEIPLAEIESPKIQKLIADMKRSLATQEDGIGLAAPQIGVPLQVFIVSKKIFADMDGPAPKDKDVTGNSDGAKSAKSGGDTVSGASLNGRAAELKKKMPVITDDLVFINPKITNYSKEKKWMEGEGCLSVRWVYGKVQRSTKVTIRAYNEHGKVFERGAGGLLAHIFQHEVDHLNGILFIDKAKDLEEVDPKDTSRRTKRK